MIFHIMFDVGGNFPVAGELLDRFNALLYLRQGDYVNAAASTSAMIPIIGTGLKYGVKSIAKSEIKLLNFLKMIGTLLLYGE